MHEVLLLGIAVSELTAPLTSDPRDWPRRLSLFLTLFPVVICCSWLILDVSAVMNVVGATLVFAWPVWGLVSPLACGVLARWALAPVGFITLLSLDPLNLPLLSLHSGRPIDLIIAAFPLTTSPVNHLITAILQYARGRASIPVSGWINVPVLPVVPVMDAKSGEDDAEESTESEVISGVLFVLGAQVEGEGVTAPCGGCWIKPFKRLLTIILVSVGAEAVIAAAVAAERVIRFLEIPQDLTGEKAEKLLIDSVSSQILAALVLMFTCVVSLR